MAFPHAAASKGEQFWSCDPLPGFDSKPLFASVEVCGTATASNWVRSWDLGRHRIHPDTGATLLLLFPGEKWRLCLENLDAYREVLVSLHVDGRNAASGGCVRVSPSSKFLWEGWRDGNGNVIAPFVATEMPTIERRLDATEAAAAAEVGGLRIECAYEVMLEAPRPYTFSAGGDGHGPIRGSEPIALSSTKKVDQGLGTAPPPATASAVSRTITSVMGPTHARSEFRPPIARLMVACLCGSVDHTIALPCVRFP